MMKIVQYKNRPDYLSVYVDSDDCLSLNNKINVDPVSFLYKSFNEGKKIILLTKHNRNIFDTLKKYRLYSFFDKVIHILPEEKKSEYIVSDKSIFIDDSFAERRIVAEEKQIPVFSPDMVECLL